MKHPLGQSDEIGSRNKKQEQQEAMRGRTTEYGIIDRKKGNLPLSLKP
jgi:hypothetical protein